MHGSQIQERKCTATLGNVATLDKNMNALDSQLIFVIDNRSFTNEDLIASKNLGMKIRSYVAGCVCFGFLASLSCFSDCVSPPSGIVAWWQAEGNANDSANLNAGTIRGGLTFATGEVGQAFNFNGSNSVIQVPASSSLDVGANNGLTIETWICPTDISKPHPLLQWNSNGGLVPQFGISFWISLPPTNGGTGPGCLAVDLKDSGFKHRIVCTSSGLVASGTWQHVGATYDKSTGIASLYYNGSLVLQTNLGNVSPYTAQDLSIGCETDPISNEEFSSIGHGQAWFAGQIDELAFYNRALSGSEIQSLFNAGTAGKCGLAPSSVVVQPVAETVAEGEAGTFSLIASGSPPLNYQWAFNGTNILNATNSSLVLTNVQMTDAGFYSVVISNVVGYIVSSNANLTVLPSYAPTWTLTTAPTNLYWVSLSVSANGKKIAAVGQDVSTANDDGSIYTSSDGGVTWISNNVPKLTWSDIASSADGNKLAAVAVTLSTVGAPPGGIYTSTNAGVAWQLSASGSHSHVVSSKDGNRLVVTYGSDIYHICVSADGGKSWTQISTPGYGMKGSACSADGTEIFGVDLYNNIYRSLDSGNTWSLTGAPNTNYWFGLASSADGTKVTAVAAYDNNDSNTFIFSSSDSGVSWSANGAPMQPWGSIACSDDGRKLVAGAWPGYLYVSTDSGTNWTATRAPSSWWSRVASDADGTLLVAAQFQSLGQFQGGIYIWKPTALSISTSGNYMQISWPTNVPGFVLQEKDMVGSSGWVNVTNLPSITNAEYQVAMPVSADSMMFRLTYP
jgi:hypothetical protein